MTDPMDRLLQQLPSPQPPENLAERLLQAVRARRQAEKPFFFWAGARSQRLAAGLGLAGLALLVLFGLEIGGTATGSGPGAAVLAWLGRLWSAPQTALADLSAWWSGFSSLAATALPLALALLALAAFLQASCLLSSWAETSTQLQLQKGKV
ncbi:MAG: hypothetical protein D6775_15255 [Caldilineae bacterium]|nr:MAG: hypothetical protein D6775_15255 [Caldilineae bacterium]